MHTQALILTWVSIKTDLISRPTMTLRPLLLVLLKLPGVRKSADSLTDTQVTPDDN